MYYMNKTKRNLILAAGIVGLVVATLEILSSSMMYIFADEINLWFQKTFEADYAIVDSTISFTYTLITSLIPYIGSVVGSIFLIYSVREKGKYFRTSRGLYLAGVIISIICGDFISWLLLLISMFISDVVVINSASEVRRQEQEERKEEKLKEQAYEEKKRKIEDLKQLRDNGVLTEEEYKEKLFEIL